MSYFDYTTSQQIVAKDYTFYALIMAAMRQADTNNLAELKEAFPSTYDELEKRYEAPGGFLADESPLPVGSMQRAIPEEKHYGDTNRDVSPGEHAEDSLGEGLAQDTVQPVQE